MANIRKHTEVSQGVFGDASLGADFQKLLDEHRHSLGYYHRRIDHDFERLLAIGEEYGEQGLKEIILHLCLDYKLYSSAGKFKDYLLEAAHAGESVPIGNNRHLELTVVE